MSNNLKPSISILLPTRGRTQALERSIMSLIDMATDPTQLQFMLAFDNDDKESSTYFVNNIAGKINAAAARYTCLEFAPIGYIRLNEYVNHCAQASSGDWLMFWNDDAVMQSANWDQEIQKHTGKFCCLRIPTHNLHPYAIFPIVPRQWYELFEYVSPHQLSDAWISQICYMLDIMKNVDIQVLHDRHDLTGNNGDQTFKNRRMLEGNDKDPRDFNHVTWRQRRFNDAVKIHAYLESVAQDSSWFRNVLEHKQEPWAKMCSSEFDPNHQLKQYKVVQQ